MHIIINNFDFIFCLTIKKKIYIYTHIYDQINYQYIYIVNKSTIIY